MPKIKLVTNEAASADVKDLATYIKGIQPEQASVSDAFGNKRTVTFPKWYGDTQKLLFPCIYYTSADMAKILKSANDYVAQKYGDGAYSLSMEKNYAPAFHAPCYTIRIK